MRMQDAAVLEVDELVLSAPADAGNPHALQRAALGSRYPTAQRRVMNVERCDPTADDEGPKRDDCPLDFR